MRSDLSKLPLNQARSIFCKVFLFAFVIQMVKMTIFLSDGEMWAYQIRYFLTNDPYGFDLFHAGYGHPGTTLMGLGSLFHILFGLSYSTALTLSVTLLIATVTAACAALCYLLQPQSLWWFTTGFILTLSRLYVTATPPSAVVMPFITLVVLALCWLLKQNISVSIPLIFLWGIILGLSAATRLDITLLVGIPLIILFCYGSGMRVLVPVITGGVISFILSDPYLWFMPVQHVIDLWSKFTVHYSSYPMSRSLPWFEWVQGVPLAVIAIAWFLFLHHRRRLSSLIPTQVLFVFLWISLLAVMILVSSKFQAIRYLFPLIIVWEVFLPLFALQGCPHNYGGASLKFRRLDARTSWVIAGFIIPTQVIGYIFMFID
jgi:hypothetical protein